MSKLLDHIRAQQGAALRIEFLVQAAHACADEPTLNDELIAILEAAHRLARGLNLALDSVSLPNDENTNMPEVTQ